MEVTKPKVVIAGAGGGKTHQMINEIIKILPELKKHPEKFCAVITYTNSATEEIKQRISNITGIPKNLHISTTHSFLTKFIIEPYAHLYNILPLEKNYIESCVLPSWEEDFFNKKINKYIGRQIAKSNRLKKIASELSTNKGLVIYDKILESSNTLIENELVCDKVSNRLAYIFVDEYQDMRIYQHNIFRQIIKKGKTNFYSIGDPLQSIFNFTYNQSQLTNEPQPNSFNESPILELNNLDLFEKEIININNRCSYNITEFINIYNQIINYKQQIPPHKNCNGVPVYFINENSKNEIISKFEDIITANNIQFENGKMFSLIIAKDWSVFDDIENINSINNENKSSTTVFNECSRCVLGALGINKSTFLDIIPFKNKSESYIEYRKFCFSILKDLRTVEYNVDSNYIIEKFRETFKVELKDDSSKRTNVTKTIEKLKIINKISDENKFCSSIHTSKGLEATNVLVIAKTNNQLLKWLDYKNVIHNKDDDYRLGYVAFSRAREMLCITCLEKPNNSVISRLESLNIKIV